MKSKLSEDGQKLRNDAKKMIDEYAETLPDSMPADDFFKSFQEGGLLKKLITIAEDIVKKKTDL